MFGLVILTGWRQLKSDGATAKFRLFYSIGSFLERHQAAPLPHGGVSNLICSIATLAHWPSSFAHLTMASRFCRSRALAPALQPSRPVLQAHHNGSAMRCLATTTAKQYVAMPKDVQNMRDAPREPQGPLKAPLVNPADKYASKSEDLHRYGTWVMGCLPKYVQQISVWKDELTIYISPEGVLPVFSFLKCTRYLSF